MEIRRLNLTAFGPFTDRTLELDQERGGLYIVYGPNEAGKSSALRGLKALLFNISVRTPDNFIHANDKLLIEGCLRAADGRELGFVRRKGSKNTLLSLQGEPLDDKVLIPFLQGVTPELFEMMFGIDHRALLKGGQEVLEQKGEVGQALFSASLGSHALHEVLDQLDQEANGLFLPQGSKPTINVDLRKHADLKRQIRDRALSSRKWEEQLNTLTRTTNELDLVQAELADNRVEVNRLKRIQRSLPKLARRHELLQKFEALGKVTVLPVDFADRHQSAVTGRETAQTILQRAGSRRDNLKEQIDGLTVRPEILEQGEIVEALHAQLGSYRTAMKDRPYLEAEYKQILTDAESLLKDVRSDLSLSNTEVLRPAFAKRQKIIELGTQKSVLVSQIKHAKNKLSETEIRLSDTCKEREQLTDIRSTDALRRAIAAARKVGNIDNTIQTHRSEIAVTTKDCIAALARLTLWEGTLQDIPSLPVPNRASISRFEELYAELDKLTQRSQEKQHENSEAVSEASLRLDEIQRAGPVPTEEELIALRNERQQVWQLLRRQWEDGEAVTAEAGALDAERALPDAFEYRMSGADELADRLRREAERVHSQATLLAELESAKQRTGALAQQLEDCAAKQQQIDTDWQALWAPCQVQPLTPREMREWVDNLDKLCDRLVQLNTLQQQASDLEHAYDAQIKQLNQQLQPFGKDRPDANSLEALLVESEELVAEIEKGNRKRETLDNEIKTLERDKEYGHSECLATSNKLDTWKMQWKDLMEDVGLEGETSPSDATDIIDKLRDLFEKQGDAKKLHIRIQAIDEDEASFNDQVGKMVAKAAPELANLDKEEAVMRLITLLSESRTRQSRRLQIEQQLQEAQQEIQDSEATIQSMTERLDTLCAEAKCDSHTELGEAERRSAEHLGLKAEVDGIEKEILDAGEGATVAETEVETQSVDSDALPAQIEALTQKIDEELEPRQTTLAEAKGRHTMELELMDGSDEVAVLANQSQSVLASIRVNAERFVRRKLAARILRDEIERYRKDNQGPLIKRASEWFAKLTCGSFESLTTDFNEKDEPVLAGIRLSGERVHVEGMSNGTRDQLYLALRLASLEKYIESSEPMPFIVDDILVDFDDQRSEAALSALAELAQKTQVILFTHHSRVVEQAQKLEGKQQVHIHEL